jgi:hypothetical protein
MSGADESITIPISVSQSIEKSIINQMETQAVNVKIQLDSAAFVNSDGDLIMELLRMNMDMVFQSVCQVVRTILF